MKNFMSGTRRTLTGFLAMSLPAAPLVISRRVAPLVIARRVAPKQSMQGTLAKTAGSRALLAAPLVFARRVAPKQSMQGTLEWIASRPGALAKTVGSGALLAAPLVISRRVAPLVFARRVAPLVFARRVAPKQSMQGTLAWIASRPGALAKTAGSRALAKTVGSGALAKTVGSGALAKMTAWRFLAMALLAALASASLTLAGCEDIAGGIGGKPADITYAVTPDGGAAAPSTKIDFTFSAAVTGLKAEDITLAPDTAVAKETLSGGGTSWSLGITVQTAGNVKVSINKEGIESAEKPVTLSKGGTPPTPPTPPTQTQYTITFNADGGSPASQTRTVNHGGTAGTANMPTADRSGYTFGGWYTSTGGNGSQFTGSTTVNSNITVYAKWTASGGTPPTQYTITFNADGGSPASQTRTVNHGGTAGTANMPTAARSGYTFGGWYTSTGGNGSQFTGSTTVNSNITVYAKWTPITYTVKYHANGGIGTTDSSVHTYDVSKNLTANGFTRTGYTFAYWSIFDGSGTRYADGQSVKNLSNTQGATKTLYAQWTVNTFGQPITLTINDFIDHAGGVITEAPFTLSKSSSPSKPITVSGGGGTDITWYIGLAQIGTGSSITISATNLSVGPHTLRVTALYSGKQYSKEITFTVQQ